MEIASYCGCLTSFTCAAVRFMISSIFAPTYFIHVFHGKLESFFVIKILWKAIDAAKAIFYCKVIGIKRVSKVP